MTRSGVQCKAVLTAITQVALCSMAESNAVQQTTGLLVSGTTSAILVRSFCWSNSMSLVQCTSLPVGVPAVCITRWSSRVGSCMQEQQCRAVKVRDFCVARCTLANGRQHVCHGSAHITTSPTTLVEYAASVASAVHVSIVQKRSTRNLTYSKTAIGSIKPKDVNAQP